MKPFIIPIFLPQAGCPHRCVFCNQYAITNVSTQQIHPNHLSGIVDQFLKYNHHQNANVQISFYGGNFLGLPENQILQLLETAQTYIHSQKIQSIRFSTRPDTIKKNRLQLLKNYAIKTIELGVQSMNDQILALSRRGHSSDDTRLASMILKDYGYQVGHQLMPGLPGDTDKTFDNTIEEVIALKPDFVRLYPTLVLKGSLLAKWYLANRYTPLTLNRAVSLVKNCLKQFQNNQIPVIRMGIQPQDQLERYILAGPYHPAFGHLVYSEILLDSVTETIKQTCSNQIIIVVNPRQVSKLKGINQNNVMQLTHRFPQKNIRIVSDPGIPNLCVLEI
ncbi:MAG: radical SAM domain-containing protein [Candidatus Magnetoglobus multicellularis str. Araruama]|uniref:Radical SAM domain-containing protein n=1 Tax=Candidatus Magnetoglobus multicellularis str. Araruama TaxID=890399 RepID=A0A1V1P981_9BACT|nr:MAG: radical SAM domain-containing protein [Candidatus Magnetoglobus multicellularis str. Araruama]